MNLKSPIQSGPQMASSWPKNGPKLAPKRLPEGRAILTYRRKKIIAPAGEKVPGNTKFWSSSREFGGQVHSARQNIGSGHNRPVLQKYPPGLLLLEVGRPLIKLPQMKSMYIESRIESQI